MDALSKHQIDNDSDTDIEDEEFKCCVCLELMYKPVVLACGHICCFWCVFQTMNFIVESNCPICRHPYNHFPNVCVLLHYVIQTLYPVAYKKRELQVTEEEKKNGNSSPQIPENVYVLALVSQSSCHETSIEMQDPSCAVDSSENIISDKPGCSEVVSEGRVNCESSGNRKFLNDSSEANDSYQHRALKKLFSEDYTCPACKSMLFRPVVLNCGHVHCERCLSNLQRDILTCQVCESPNPNGMPKVCLVLDHLIAKHFQQLYSERRNSLLNQAGPSDGDPSNSTTQASQNTINTEDYALWWTGRGPKIHIGYGCDYCGMTPIVGDRYRCIDCTENMGFDLCETCYARSSVLPGRFNQQHKPDHRCELQELTRFNHVYIRHELGEPDAEDGLDDADGLPRTPTHPDAPPL